MAGEWNECSLGDLIAVKHGFAFQGEFIHDDPRGDILLTPGNFSIRGGFKGDKFKYFDGPVPDDFVLADGDLLVTMTDLSKQSDTLGFPAFVPSRTDGRRYLHNQRLGKVLVKNDRAIDIRYLHYLLCSSAYRHEVLASATGTTVKHTSPERIERFRFMRPSLAEQRAIAHILGTLDDKIELNRRMSETLEAIARALFRSWFVDFDPVRAKSEGRDPGLPRKIAGLFPGHLVESELGEIPEGWEVAPMANHFEAVKGVSYKGSGLGDKGVPLHNLNSIHEGGGYKYEGIKYYSGQYADRHVVMPGDVIVANTEQGHDRLLIGYAALVPSSFGDHGIASHHVYRLRPKPRSPLTKAYLCWLLNDPQMHDVVSGYANGTTVNMLPLDGVQKPAIVCPPKEVVGVFDSIARIGVLRREEMVSESRCLAALRDALLPKLVSGALRTKTVERTARDVA